VEQEEIKAEKGGENLEGGRKARRPEGKRG
jgi:hypothetical protein